MSASPPTAPLDPLQQHLADEWQVFLHAPFLFVGSVLVAAIIIWRLVRAHYAGQIGTLKERVEWSDAQLQEYKDKLKGSSPDEAKARFDVIEQELERLRRRHLTDEQQRLMIAVLSGHPGAIFIAYDSSCPDGRSFSSAIKATFMAAGWSATNVQVFSGIGWPREGLSVQIPGKESLTPVQSAVTKALDAAGLFHRIERETPPREGFDAELFVCERTSPLSPQPAVWA